MEPQTSQPAQARFAFDAATEASFDHYISENPRVLETLLRFALEARRAGRTRMSIHMLCERLRWHTNIETKGESFRVNNNWRPLLARRLMREEPELRGFFETRVGPTSGRIAA